MTTNETGQPVAAAMARHSEHGATVNESTGDVIDADHCHGCGEPWPCDVAVLARELERLREFIADWEDDAYRAPGLADTLLRVRTMVLKPFSQDEIVAVIDECVPYDTPACTETEE